MPIPPLQKQLIEQRLEEYCKERFPKETQDQIRLSFSIRGNNVNLIESRPFRRDKNQWTDSKIAQFRFDAATAEWSLFCRDRNEKWHPYLDGMSSIDVDALIREVNNDPTGIFWG